jgi:hypothetical protein
VGAYRDDTGGINRGALHVLFLNADGSVKNSLKIANTTNGGPALADHDRFGSGVAAIDDLDSDGAIELAVGAEMDSTGGNARGAVHILFLQPATTAPLPGDFNNSGTVDMADFVVWRKTLGSSVPPFSGADGSGNGIVDQADYDVWRANFGRTAAAGASTSALAVAMVEPAENDRTNGRMADVFASGSPQIVVPSIPMARPSIHDGAPTTGRTWPRGRDTFSLASSHDDALIAWLASRDTGLRPDSAASLSFKNRETQAGPRRLSDQPMDSLDLAFAMLGP